jgi:hypothetical protein
MGRTQGRSPKGQHSGDEGGGSGFSDFQVEVLRQRFALFRRGHRPGTRYPEDLRAAVLAALQGGAAELELRRLCRLSTVQLAAWRRHEGAAARSRALVRPPARVFSVVDEVHPEVSVERAVSPGGEDLELLIGGWAVRIRRVEG